MRPASPWGDGRKPSFSADADGEKKEEGSSAASTVRGWITGAATASAVAQTTEPNAFKGKAKQAWVSSKLAPISKWGGDLATRLEKAEYRNLRRLGNTLGVVGLGYAGFDMQTAVGAGDEGGIALAGGDLTMAIIGLTPAAPGTLVYEPVKAWGDYTQSGAWYRSQVVESFCIVSGDC